MRARILVVALVAIAIVGGVIYTVAAGRPGQQPSPGASASSAAVESAAPGESAAAAASPGAPTPAPSQGPPSSQQLIGAALDKGTIDYPTSLLYRAYALFGTADLPAEFAGGGSIGEDPGLFAEPFLLGDALPPDIRAKLEPFLVRPTDSKSIFSATQTGAVDAHLAIARTTTAAGAPRAGALTCTNGWASKESVKEPGTFKVWAKCRDNYEQDINVALATADQIWSPMVDFMGSPKADLETGEPPDRWGGSRAIDLYLLDDGDCAQRYGCKGFKQDEGLLGITFPAPPVTGKTGSQATSAFVVVRRGLLPGRPGISENRLRSVLIHEFFHVLEYAHNFEIVFKKDAKGQLINEVNWFSEASAVWAQTYFDRDSSSHASSEVYAEWFPDFQIVSLPLQLSNKEDKLHLYSSFVWLYFMEQVASAQSIANVWKAVEGGTTWDDLTSEINVRVPFPTRFRDFAVRNLDKDFLPNDPMAPRYQALDKNFPLLAPTIENEGEGSLVPQDETATPLKLGEGLGSLMAHYYRFDLTGDELGRLVVDFSALAPASAVDVDALVKIRDKGWERRRLGPGETTFCRTVASDRVDEIYLVISNHDMTPTSAVKGDFSVLLAKQPCTGIVGRVSFTASGQIDPNDKWTVSLDVHLRWNADSGVWTSDSGTWSLSGANLGSENGFAPAGTYSGGGALVENFDPLTAGEGIGQADLTISDHGTASLGFIVNGHYSTGFKLYDRSTAQTGGMSFSIADSGGPPTYTALPNCIEGTPPIGFDLHESCSGTLTQLSPSP